MKKLVYMVMALVWMSVNFDVVFSQGRTPIHENPKYGSDSASRVECAKNLSTTGEFVRINMFDYAYPSWKYCFSNCPQASKNIYLHGVKIMHHKIKNAQTDEERSLFIDSLMMVYEQRIEYFKQEYYVRGRQGMDLLIQDPSRSAEAYRYLEKSVELGKNKDEIPVYVQFIQASYLEYRAGHIDADAMVNNFVLASDYLNTKNVRPKNEEKAKSAMEEMERMLAESGAASCDKLIKIFQPKFEATPENLDLLKKITKILKRSKCEATDLFASAAENLYELEPSAEAAYNLAKLFYTRSEYSKCKDYYLKAIKEETDVEKKANMYYELGGISLVNLNQPALSRDYAYKAIELKANWGKPYILIGNAYVSSCKSCGENDFEKSAVFWAAVDKYAKAKNVDPSIAGEAQDLINNYSKYFPNNEDAFFYGYTDGQTYTVGCWINEKTKVRTIKTGS